MEKYDAKRFLEEVAKECAEDALAERKFTADSDLFGSHVLSALRRVESDAMYLEALRKNRWVVAQSPEADDGRWRVWSADTGKIVAGIKEGGDDWEDALDIAMIAKAFAEAPRLSVSGSQGKR